MQHFGRFNNQEVTLELPLGESCGCFFNDHSALHSAICIFPVKEHVNKGDISLPKRCLSVEIHFYFYLLTQKIVVFPHINKSDEFSFVLNIIIALQSNLSGV